MAEGRIKNTELAAIAAAIRSKNGESTIYKPAEMAQAILDIPTGGSAVIESKNITANGAYTAPTGVDGYSPVVVDVQPNLQSKTATQNGTVTPDAGYDALSSVVVNVSGGGGDAKGFEVYAADGGGNVRENSGCLDNQYFCCYFDDNMAQQFTLNGTSYNFSVIAAGKQQTLATTRAVADNQSIEQNAVFREGSVFTVQHSDTGSYISVVGGWFGYPTGGTIYEQAASGTANSITLASAHSTLLIFLGACFNADGVSSVEINGNTYNITNIGYHYGAYGVFGAIEVNGNTDTAITATFPASGWSYLSIIGID